MSWLVHMIKKTGRKLPGYFNLSSARRIELLGAGVLLTAIESVEDFQVERMLASYFVTIPPVKNSNATEHPDRITKAGSWLAAPS